MELETVGFGSIRESNDVVRVSDGAENVLLLPGGVVGNDAGLQLGELVGSAANPNEDGCLFLLVRVLEDLVDAAFPVFEGRFEAYKRVGGSSDSKLFHDVSALKHVPGPLICFGASFETFYGQHFRLSRRRV